jgi:hypothetical protein
MKITSVIMLSMLSVSAFATDLKSTVAAIEAETNATCESRGRARGILGANFCLGPNTISTDYYYGADPLESCWYSVNYDCVSNEGDFTLRIKVKEFYNYREQVRQSKVVKTTIIRR